MSTQEILDLLVRAVVIPAIPVLTVYVISLIKKLSDRVMEKTSNENIDRYIQLVTDELEKAIKATTQTYVSTIKSQTGKLTREQQIMAFQKSKEAFEKSMGASAKTTIEFLYGDYNQWLETTMEALIKDNK